MTIGIPLQGQRCHAPVGAALALFTPSAVEGSEVEGSSRRYHVRSGLKE